MALIVQGVGGPKMSRFVVRCGAGRVGGWEGGTWVRMRSGGEYECVCVGVQKMGEVEEEEGGRGRRGADY